MGATTTVAGHRRERTRGAERDRGTKGIAYGEANKGSALAIKRWHDGTLFSVVADHYAAQSRHSTSACSNTSSVAFSCLSGG